MALVEYSIGQVYSWEIEKLAGRAVDTLVARLPLSEKDSVSIGDEFVLRDHKGNVLFGGWVVDKKTENSLEVRVNSYGDELSRVTVQEVYYGQSPEAIVQDLVTRYTSLSYASTATSGITLDRWIVRGTLAEEVKKLAHVLGWQYRTDDQKNFYFEPEGSTLASQSISVGSNAGRIKWRLDTRRMANWIVLKGGDALLSTVESFSGDGVTTEFSLAYKPTGSVRVTVDGVEKKGGPEGEPGIDYYVDAEGKKLVFSAAPAAGTGNIVVEYSFYKPIIVEARDDESISVYGVYKREIVAKWVKTHSEARKVARKMLDKLSRPRRIGRTRMLGLCTFNAGERVYVEDPVEGVSGYYTIKSVRKKSGTIEVEVGEPEEDLLDWAGAVQERIKELERLLSTEGVIQKYESIKESVRVSSVSRVTIKTRSINDSMIWSHPNPTNGAWGTARWGDRRGAWTVVYQE